MVVMFTALASNRFAFYVNVYLAYTYFPFCVHLPYFLCILTLQFVYTYCTFCVYLLCILCTLKLFILYTLTVHFVYIVHLVYIHCTFVQFVYIYNIKKNKDPIKKICRIWVLYSPGNSTLSFFNRGCVVCKQASDEFTLVANSYR